MNTLEFVILIVVGSVGILALVQDFIEQKYMDEMIKSTAEKKIKIE